VISSSIYWTIFLVQLLMPVIIMNIFITSHTHATICLTILLFILFMSIILNKISTTSCAIATVCWSILLIKLFTSVIINIISSTSLSASSWWCCNTLFNINFVFKLLLGFCFYLYLILIVCCLLNFVSLSSCIQYKCFLSILKILQSTHVYVRKYISYHQA
jgi:hypothetical protein